MGEISKILQDLQDYHRSSEAIYNPVNPVLLPLAGMLLLSGVIFQGTLVRGNALPPIGFQKSLTETGGREERYWLFLRALRASVRDIPDGASGVAGKVMGGEEAMPR